MDLRNVSASESKTDSGSYPATIPGCISNCGRPKASVLVVVLTAGWLVLAFPPPATAWWMPHAFRPRIFVNPPGTVWPGAVFPGGRPYPLHPGLPPGAPLSYDDPSSGTTYCFSQTTGFYFPCGYSIAPSPSAFTGPLPPMPPPGVSSLGAPGAGPASGVLIFRLPRDAEVAVDGVPIGLSEGLGAQAVTPGQHRVVVKVPGKQTEYPVEVTSHGIFTVSPTGILPTDP
jgi:hypothetical protein